jgi:hypothetical protein
MDDCIGHYRPRLETIQIVTELATDMAGPARRDLVWDAALRVLVSNPASIRLRDVQLYIDEAEVSDRTVRRTMNAMQALGWLEKDTEGGHYWFPGPKAREFLRVPGSGRPGDRREVIDERDERAPGVDLDQDVDGGTDVVEAGGAALAPEPERGEIEAAVEIVDVRAQGQEMERRRRELLQAILKYIRDESEVKPAAIRGRFYPDAEAPDGVEKSEAADATGYGSERSWWKNFVYQGLSEVDLVKTGGEGSHTWFYVGEAAT